jgi:hypothetical protein
MSRTGQVLPQVARVAASRVQYRGTTRQRGGQGARLGHERAVRLAPTKIAPIRTHRYARRPVRPHVVARRNPGGSGVLARRIRAPRPLTGRRRASPTATCRRHCLHRFTTGIPRRRYGGADRWYGAEAAENQRGVRQVASAPPRSAGFRGSAPPPWIGRARAQDIHLICRARCRRSVLTMTTTCWWKRRS